MSRVALARLERPRRLNLYAWALTEQSDSETHSNVRTLAADGMPRDGAERALAQPTHAPVGAAAWLASEEGTSLTPCVVVGVTEAGSRLRVLTPQGEVDSTMAQVRPVPSPG